MSFMHTMPMRMRLPGRVHLVNRNQTIGGPAITVPPLRATLVNSRPS